MTGVPNATVAWTWQGLRPIHHAPPPVNTLLFSRHVNTTVNTLLFLLLSSMFNLTFSLSAHRLCIMNYGDVYNDDNTPISSLTVFPPLVPAKTRLQSAPPELDSEERGVFERAGLRIPDELSAALVGDGISVEDLQERFPSIVLKGKAQYSVDLARLQWEAAQDGDIRMGLALGRSWLGQTDKGGAVLQQTSSRRVERIETVYVTSDNPDVEEGLVDDRKKRKSSEKRERVTEITTVFISADERVEDGVDFEAKAS